MFSVWLKPRIYLNTDHGRWEVRFGPGDIKGRDPFSAAILAIAYCDRLNEKRRDDEYYEATKARLGLAHLRLVRAQTAA